MLAVCMGYTWEVDANHGQNLLSSAVDCSTIILVVWMAAAAIVSCIKVAIANVVSFVQPCKPGASYLCYHVEVTSTEILPVLI